MKKGFTLAELLIVLGITGITAAILLPAINNLMPDKTKILYLKAYDELKTAIQSLASNSSLYPICLEQGDTTIGCQEHPLINTSKPLIKKFESYTGDTKLCKLLAFSMDAQESCQEGNYSYSDTTFTQNLSFTTKNGMQWKIVPQARTIESDKATYQSDVYVDVDPSKKSKNCMYSPTCKHPDRFKFLVAADGSVIPADPMGLMYVNTRKSYMKNKGQKADGEVAAILDDELREFGYRPCGESNNMNEIEPPDEPPEIPSPDPTPEPQPEPAGKAGLACGDSYEGYIVNCVQENDSSTTEFWESISIQHPVAYPLYAAQPVLIRESKSKVKYVGLNICTLQPNSTSGSCSYTLLQGYSPSDKLIRKNWNGSGYIPYNGYADGKYILLSAALDDKDILSHNFFYIYESPNPNFLGRIATHFKKDNIPQNIIDLLN